MQRRLSNAVDAMSAVTRTVTASFDNLIHPDQVNTIYMLKAESDGYVFGFTLNRGRESKFYSDAETILGALHIVQSRSSSSNSAAATYTIAAKTMQDVEKIQNFINIITANNQNKHLDQDKGYGGSDMSKVEGNIYNLKCDLNPRESNLTRKLAHERSTQSSQLQGGNQYPKPNYGSGSGSTRY